MVYEEGLRLQGAGAGCVSIHADLIQQGEQDLWKGANTHREGKLVGKASLNEPVTKGYHECNVWHCVVGVPMM